MIRLLVAALAILAAVSVSAQEKRVVVYTAHIAAIIDKLQPLFERETGIKLEIVKAGSGDIIRRVKAEAAAPKADVIWSIGGEQLEDNKDLLAAFTPKEADKLLPAYKVSPEWLPYTGIMTVFAVNTKKLAPAQYPKSWKDLTDPKWKGMISSARADNSGSAFIQLAIVLSAYGEGGWDIFKSMMANFAISDSSGAVSRFVNDGEALVGLTLEDNALQYVKGGGNVAIVYPEDGSAAIADGVALVKGGPNPANAKIFIDWLLSKPVQTMLVQDIGRRSVRSDIETTGIKPISEIKLVNYDMKTIAKNRTAWIAQWRKLLQNR
jgi:iron(III) transport system substrate-binding protein